MRTCEAAQPASVPARSRHSDRKWKHLRTRASAASRMRSRHRAARPLRATQVCASLLAVLMLVGVGRLPLAGAAFSAATADGQNRFGAATLAPPTNLVADSSCTGGPVTMPTLVAAGTPSESGTTITLNRPAGAVGDLVVVILIAGTSTAPPLSGATPAFTTAVSATAAGTTLLSIHVLYRRITDASEPTTYTFSPTTGRATGVVRVYRSIDTTTPFGSATTPWSANTSGTTTTAPSLTTNEASDLVIAVQATRSGNTAPNYTGSTGTTLADVTAMTTASPASTTVTGRVGDIAMPSAGASGDSTISHASASPRMGLQIPLRPGSKGQITTSWNASTVPAWADGYELTRTNGGVIEATVPIPGASTAQYIDATAANGTFTYSLRSTKSLWRSAAVTTTVSRNC